MYFGPCDEAVAYFDNLGNSTKSPDLLGAKDSPDTWTCPDHTNPADFFMRLFVNPQDNDNASARRTLAQDSYAESIGADKGGAVSSTARQFTSNLLLLVISRAFLTGCV